MGRDCTTCRLAPPLPALLGPPTPTGIGVIGVPAVGATAASAIAALDSSPPSPGSAEVATRTGMAPCHVGGTDIAPTNRAWPNPAPTGPKPAAAPPNPFISGTLELTGWGTSATPVDTELANPAPFAACARLIIGDATMPAGYIPTCATDTNDVSGAADTVAGS